MTYKSRYIQPTFIITNTTRDVSFLIDLFRININNSDIAVDVFGILVTGGLQNKIANAYNYNIHHANLT